jgi:hypothetical protein
MISARNHRFRSIRSELKAKIANATKQHGSTVTTHTKGPQHESFVTISIKES